MIRKFGTIEIKAVDAAEGVVEAYVNTMGVKDKDGDIIEATAFDDSIANNLPISVLSSHDQNSVVGKVVSAVVEKVSDKLHRLKATMQMNLETQLGRDAFSNVAGSYIKEWSVGFNLKDDSVEVERQGRNVTRHIKNLDWVEVSAVVRGASPDTATIAAKTDKEMKAIPSHSTQTTEGTWSGPNARAALPRGADPDSLRSAFAWVNSSSNPANKSSYRFIHHVIDDSGNVGPANIKACAAAIGVLNGGRGGTTIPTDERQGVYRHLARHIKEGGKKAPELKPMSRVWSRVRRTDEMDKVKVGSIEVEKPYPNIHACRVIDPASFDNFRTTTTTIEEGDHSGKQVEILWGHDPETDDWAIASYHLPSVEWTEEQGLDFCNDHDGILFEPATNEETDDDSTEADTAADAQIEEEQVDADPDVIESDLDDEAIATEIVANAERQVALLQAILRNRDSLQATEV